MDLSKCAERCGQLLVILIGFVFFFGGIPVLLISLEEHSEPYWIIIGSLIVITGLILVTLGASGCCYQNSDKETGFPYGHLEEEIKTEGLTPGIYCPYHPYTNQPKFEHWVDIQISQHEKNSLTENRENNIESHCNVNDNSVIDIKYDIIYNQPLPI